jgi:acetyl esterase
VNGVTIFTKTPDTFSYKIKMKKNIACLILLLAVCWVSGSEAKRLPGAKPKKILYKKVDGHKLYLHVFFPKKKSKSPVPGAIFFHSGGFNSGKPQQFYAQAKHLSDKGMVAMSAEYRIKNTHKSTPFDAVEDAKSAMRFIRKNAWLFGIDPDKILAAGASAGGHLAVSTGTLKGFNAKSDDLSISSRPTAAVLFCPVYDNGPGGYAYGRPGMAKRYKEFSPIHNISGKMPPTLVMVGSKDVLLPTKTAKKFQSLMRKAGVKSELKVYQGQGHGFFNYGGYYDKTLKEMDQFLKEMKLL